jgi:hypothetical protein
MNQESEDENYSEAEEFENEDDGDDAKLQNIRKALKRENEKATKVMLQAKEDTAKKVKPGPS